MHDGLLTDNIHFIAEGWACRFKLTKDGHRQIVALLTVGDVCNLDALVFGAPNYGVWMLTKGKILSLARTRALKLVAEYPGIARRYTWLGFVENAILMQGILRLGRKSARDRIAHLFCELSARFGCQDKGEVSFELPLTQEHLADALGLTTIHVNRTLRQLRLDGLMAYSSRLVTIPDVAALRQVGDFSPTYLHIDDAELSPRSINAAFLAGTET